MVTNMKSRAPIVLVPAWPALFLLIGWRVSHHPLPLHLLPVRLCIVKHVHHVIVDGVVLLLRCKEVIQVEGLQHWDRSHGKAGVVHLGSNFAITPQKNYLPKKFTVIKKEIF